jgi:segregation and condensation protein A
MPGGDFRDDTCRDVPGVAAVPYYHSNWQALRSNARVDQALRDRYTEAHMYHVRLPVFEGPFDLLLHLIEREKLDISAVSLAMVTDQFLAYVRELETIRAGDLADFLVVASRLVLMKSRLLLPVPPTAGQDEDGEDPAEELARQLREYRRFKQAAVVLQAIEESGGRTYTRVAPFPELERRFSPDDSAKVMSSCSLADLLAAARAALCTAPLPPASLPAGVVIPFTLTIRDQIRLIRQFTMEGRPVTFRALVYHARHRMEIAVTLLAVLELIKRGQITVVQRSLFGEIEIMPVPGVEITVEEVEDPLQREEGGNGRETLLRPLPGIFAGNGAM